MCHFTRLRFLIMLALLVAVPGIDAQQDSINLYTFYTPSHKIFKDEWFLPTLQDEGIIVNIKEYPQECPTGKVWEAGWQKVMLRKVDMIIEAIKINWEKVFIYADIDIQFFGPISKCIMDLIGDKDLIIQRDTPSGTLCAGFMACRGNERTLALWQAIREYMIKKHECSDQKTLNKFLRKGIDKAGKNINPHKVIWDYLPVEFLGGGTLTGNNWSPDRSFFVPINTVVHHANWTKGSAHKTDQLRYVRKAVESKRFEAERKRKIRLAQEEADVDDVKEDTKE